MSRPAALALAALLAGCAAAPPSPPVPGPGLEWQQHGRLGVRAADEQWHGTLTWEQRADGYRIEFAGPLGQGAVRLEEDAGGARLQLASDESYHERDTESLLRRHLGWYLPVRGLRHWLTGRAAPGAAGAQVRDAEGRLLRLEQDGWQVKLERYQPVSGRVLPHRVELARPDLRLRLVVDQWRLGAPG
ncbi:MAG TPA: lipoprotein insertase outer membrane protein LolB [Gammaproteobacteria bacterium]